MSRYDGLIIPRSYSEYINKTDAATLQQALQQSGVLSGAVADDDKKAVKSSAVNSAINNLSITSADLESSETAGVNKFACPRGGAFTLDYLRKQTVGSIRYYIGKVTIGSDASGGNLYFIIDGLNGSNGWVVNGTWEILNSEYKGVLFIANNTSIWLQKGETTGAERLASTEVQNKTITFRFTTTKIETPVTVSEE